MGRFAAVAASLLAALSLAGAAQATLAPAPGPLRPLLIVKVDGATHAIVSCSVHGNKGVSAKVSRIEKRLGPVACEHPPRSQLLGGNLLFGR